MARNLIAEKRCKIGTTEDMVNKIMFLQSNIDLFIKVNLTLY